MPTTLKESVYERVTARIISALEGGLTPWNRPWIVEQHRNAVSNRAYRGINVLLLSLACQERAFKRSRWLTYNQAVKLGGHVRRGEKGTTVVYYDRRPRHSEGLNQQEDDEWFFIARTHSVFNLEQVDGVTFEASQAVAPFASVDACEGVLTASGADITYGGSQALYDPTSDRIALPPRESFLSPARFYGVVMHELTHWTGAPTRLNRDHSGRYGDPSYAFEELVAELGASFVTSRCGLEHTVQAAAYIASWLQVLRKDNRAIFAAARLATAAADYLMPHTDDNPQEEDSELAA